MYCSLVLFCFALIAVSPLTVADHALTSPISEVEISSVWKTLQHLTPEEKNNAQIVLIFELAVSERVYEKGRQIETLWNNCEFSKAFEQLSKLAGITDIGKIGLAVSWRIPVPTDNHYGKGTDIRIGNRDSVDAVDFDIHRPSGNLFAALLLPGDSYINEWTLNLSTDRGSTWSEALYQASNDIITDICCAVVGDRCYVAYSPQAVYARVRKFHTSDCSGVVFSNDHLSVHAFTVFLPTVIKELCLVSHQDWNDKNNDLLYLAILTNDRNIYICHTNVESDTLWEESSPSSWPGADRCLDMTLNENCDESFLFLSYLSVDDYVNILRMSEQGTWYNSFTDPVNGTQPDFTGISAWSDTVYCVYQYQEISTKLKQVVSFNGGLAWETPTTLGDGWSTSFSAPAITLLENGGVGLAYRSIQSSSSRGYFHWTKYDDPGGGYFTSYADNSLHTEIAPGIEYLGGGEYGIVYATQEYRYAYFDLMSCCNGDGVRGNVDRIVGPGGPVAVVDLSYLVDYLFKGGPTPLCPEQGNTDGVVQVGGPIDVADLSYLVDYLFKGGPPPPACT